MIRALNYPRQIAINKLSFRFPENHMYNAVNQTPSKNWILLIVSYDFTHFIIFLDLRFHHFTIAERINSHRIKFKVSAAGFIQLLVFQGSGTMWASE